MRSSAGGAEWKTSDFVVTLIKEQQVPVCLSAQAELFSPRQLPSFRKSVHPFFLFVQQQQCANRPLVKCTQTV